MNLFYKLAAKIRLDARTMDGKRVETDTLTAAEYSLMSNGSVFLRKTVGNGLSIEAAPDGEGYLYANFTEGELSLIGKFEQRLTVSGCDSQMFGAIVRPELLYVKE